MLISGVLTTACTRQWFSVPTCCSDIVDQCSLCIATAWWRAASVVDAVLMLFTRLGMPATDTVCSLHWHCHWPADRHCYDDDAMFLRCPCYFPTRRDMTTVLLLTRLIPLLHSSCRLLMLLFLFHILVTITYARCDMFVSAHSIYSHRYSAVLFRRPVTRPLSSVCCRKRHFATLPLPPRIFLCLFSTCLSRWLSFYCRKRIRTWCRAYRYSLMVLLTTTVNSVRAVTRTFRHCSFYSPVGERVIHSHSDQRWR